MWCQDDLSSLNGFFLLILIMTTVHAMCGLLKAAGDLSPWPRLGAVRNQTIEESRAYIRTCRFFSPDSDISSTEFSLTYISILKIRLQS